MKLELKFLTSKVSKRLFFLFVIAAVIPVTITGIFSYKYVGNLLITQKQEYLDSASKNYGMAIYDRLLNAEHAFNLLAIDIQSRNAEDLARNITNISTPNSTTPIFSDTEIFILSGNSYKNDTKHLLAGNTKITISKDENSLNIYFSRLLDDGIKILSSKVDTSYIFSNLDILPTNEKACVIIENMGTLFCSDKEFYTVSENIFENVINSKNISDEIIYNSDYIFASWELFLKGKYNTDGWNIIYTTSNVTFSTSAKSFATAFIPILIFVILLITLISLNQIAKILTPLAKLTAATESIAKGDFSNKIKLTSSDEFQVLGDSFNKMSSELASVFSDISAMSELDRTILSTMDPKSAFHPIFKHLNSCFNSDFSGIIVMDSQNKDVGYLYSYDKVTNEVHTKGSVNITTENKDILFKETDTYFPIAKREQYAQIEWVNLIATDIISIVPINEKEALIGCIVCGFNSFPKLKKPDLERLEKFVDRVAVALSATKREERLTYQANYDSLTGLPNRLHLMNRFDNAIGASERNKNNIAFLFIDLDRFKVINDSQGHATGDKLLISVADRIQKCINNADTVARYGGDEFAIIIPNVSSTKDVEKTAETIIQRLSEPFYIDSYEHLIGASIGISVYPKDGNTWDELLQKSDIAMYKAKQAGRGKHLFFTDKMHEDIRDKANLEADLHHALEKNELHLVYQPQIDAKSGAITGAETLIRWNHSTKGTIRPDKFISYAEDNGLIIPIGSWIIRETLKQCEQWQLSHHTIPKIAINISAKQLRHEKFISEVEELITDFDIGSTNLEFEITESLFINDDDYTLSILHKLNKLGISIAIDDFGKGYSSLSYLKKLPVQTLKIDKLFIQDLNKNDDSIEIVNAIISMAHALNKIVVAEGIETEEQLEILKELDCDRAQGYLISKPRSSHEFHNFSKTKITQLANDTTGLKIVS